MHKRKSTPSPYKEVLHLLGTVNVLLVLTLCQHPELTQDLLNLLCILVDFMDQQTMFPIFSHLQDLINVLVKPVKMLVEPVVKLALFNLVHGPFFLNLVGQLQLLELGA